MTPGGIPRRHRRARPWRGGNLRTARPARDQPQRELSGYTPRGSSMRVVSLNCSNTEIVCALGCADRLVGVDRDSDWPTDVVERLPRVGRDLQIDIEQVQALRPDLVLASLTVPGHEKVVAGLESAGLPHYAPETITLDDAYTDIREIARRLGVTERAEPVVADMRRALEAPPAAKDRRRPSVLVQWWPKPVIAPGRRSWVHEMIERAGGHNPLGDEPVKSRPLDDAEVAALAPDAIVLSWCGVRTENYRADEVYKREAWQHLDVVRQRRVFTIPEAYLGRPGPRLAEGARALRDVIAAIRC
ncbi:MAG: cobalamin-binding protein [Planctomycetota bacterium]